MKKPKHGRLGLCSSGIWKSVSDFLRQIQNNLRLRECPLGEILHAVSHSALIGSGLPQMSYNSALQRVSSQVDTSRKTHMFSASSPLYTSWSHTRASCLVNINGITINCKMGDNKTPLPCFSLINQLKFLSWHMCCTRHGGNRDKEDGVLRTEFRVRRRPTSQRWCLYRGWDEENDRIPWKRWKRLLDHNCNTTPIAQVR